MYEAISLSSGSTLGFYQLGALHAAESRGLLKQIKVYVTGVEILKKDGTKVLCPLEPSNLMIIELNLDDKKRIKSIERK